jgi:hypothetical protein
VKERRKAMDARPAPQITPNRRSEISQTDLQQGKGPVPTDHPTSVKQAPGTRSSMRLGKL